MSPRPLDLVVTAWERERRGHEFGPEDEWYGILWAWPRHYFEVGPQLNQSDSSSEYCVHYYPQLFTGRWIPLDTAVTRHEMQEERRFETPTPLPSEIRRWINQKDRLVFRGN